jgi:hypothetical protein
MSRSDFSKFLEEAAKRRLKFLFVRDLKKKKDFLWLLEKLEAPYYCAVLVDFLVLLRFGDYISNFLSDCYRLNLKSIAVMPIFSRFMDEKTLNLIYNLGFDAVVTPPIKNLSAIEKLGIGMICFCYIKGESYLNRNLLRKVSNAVCDGLFSIDADKERIKELKMKFKKILINLGKEMADIEVES